MGLHHAFPDASILGVDIVHQPRYPAAFEFMRADASKLTPAFLAEFDYVHASPPCQHYLGSAHYATAPDYLDRIVDLLKSLPAHVAWSIENVVGAPVSGAIMLCGTMFPPLRVIRHRIFLTSKKIKAPFHIRHADHPRTHTLRRSRPNYGTTDEWKDFVSVVGGGNCSVAAAQDAMQIDWMVRRELNQAIPPVYMQYVGRELWTQHSAMIACAI